MSRAAATDLGAAPLLWADWPAPARIRALTTLRRGAGIGRSVAPFDDFNLGDRCGDDPSAVAANRRSLHSLLGLPSAPRWLRQVHGCDVHLPASGSNGDSVQPAANSGSDAAATDPPAADASVTREVGTVLAILSADCLPVLFCAVDGSEVAAAHAGWRGLASGVLEATLAAMRTPPDRLHAWLGPAAGRGAYEVGAEVRDAFVAIDHDAFRAFTPTRPGHWLCDLAGLARMRLRAAGAGSVHGGRYCTIGDPQRFYSHRRDAIGGRMASLIWIAPEQGEPAPAALVAVRSGA